jgi:ketosteroid isomerase-like protein
MTHARLPAVLERFIAAVNKGDVDAFLAFFPADGVVNDWGRRFTGHAAIRGWSDEEFIGKQVSLKVTGVEQKGNTVGVMTDVGGQGFNGPSRFTFVLDGDKVREMRITAD